MELELQKERFACYRPGQPIVASQEETAETIVPDYCPDVARIVRVSACLLLRSKSVSEGRLEASGTIKLTLLYMAENADGLRSLEYSIPFEHHAHLPDGCGEASVEGRICGADARLLNPRKLFTRLTVEWLITPYCRTEFVTCSAIPEQETCAIKTLCDKRQAALIRAVSEKSFVFADEITLPGGQDAMGELLCSQVKLRMTEAKCVGSKVVLKGIACISLLYSSAEGKLCSYATELPFSQILDGMDEDYGEASVSTVLTLSGCEIHTDGENAGSGAVSVKLFLSAFIVLRSIETVNCIMDLYSTTYDLDVQTESVALWQEPVVTVVTQSVREQLDIGTDVRCVLDAGVCFGSIAVQQNDGHIAVRTAATLYALYLDEANVPLTVERRVEIAAEADGVVGEASVSVENICADDISVSINASGMEFRFPMECRLVSISAPQCTCLTALRAEPRETGTGAPSLVLRAVTGEETLWDIAKQYRTTVEDIFAANEMSDSAALTPGQMLLIPRKR